MPKYTKLFFAGLLFFLMGALWKWWPLQSFLGGSLCFLMITSWSIEIYLDANTYDPRPGQRNSRK